MGLFGNNEEQAQQVQFEIRTQNSWLTHGVPQCIVRQIIKRGMEKLGNTGCKYVSPYIRMSDCVRIVETDQTFEILTKTDGLKIIPKHQVIEIQYF